MTGMNDIPARTAEIVGAIPADAALERAGLDGLPPLPGGWSERTLCLAGRTVAIAAPADPDGLLDCDEAVPDDADGDYLPYWARLWEARPIWPRRFCKPRPQPFQLRVLKSAAASDWPAGRCAARLRHHVQRLDPRAVRSRSSTPVATDFSREDYGSTGAARRRCDSTGSSPPTYSTIERITGRCWLCSIRRCRSAGKPG